MSILGKVFGTAKAVQEAGDPTIDVDRSSDVPPEVDVDLAPDGLAEPAPDPDMGPIPVVDAEALPDQLGLDDPSTKPGVSVLIASLEARLLAAFEQRFAVDAFKEKQIDRLHDELQGHRAGLVATATRPMVSALIRLHGNAARVKEAIPQQDQSKLTPEMVCKLFGGFQNELEAVLEDQGVLPFREEAGARFNPRRQLAVKTLATASPDLVGFVVESLRPGFLQNDLVVEREAVTVYVAGPGVVETDNQIEAQG